MYRRVAFFAALLAMLSLGHFAPELSAQVTRADSAAVLLDAADGFSAQGEHDVAQAIYSLLVRRYPGTAAAQAAAARLTSVRREGTPGSGQVELQVWSTLYGLWLGIAVPGAFGADDPEPYGVGLLAGGPAGFLAGKYLANSRNLTEGQARAITLGGTWGTWQGYGWGEVLDVGEHEYCPDPDFQADCYQLDGEGKHVFAAMVVGGAVGVAAGVALSRRSISPAVATAANFGGLWGTWMGFGLGFLADLEDDDLLAAVLVGGNAGLLGTAAMAPSWNVSRSRARLVSIYGVIGGLSGLGVDLLTQPDDDKVVVGIPLAGSILGLAVGIAATRNYDDPTSTDGQRSGGALLNFSQGSWTVGAPLPLPRRLELDGPLGPTRKTALGLTLFNAKF